MKRSIILGMALAMLIGASVAYAALNTYTASVTATGKTGTAKAPAPTGLVENLKASNTTSGSRAAPLIDIKTTVYGLVANAKSFPTCSSTTIDTGPKFDAACPKKSEVATGPVHALLGGPDLTTPGTSCDTFLHVYNGGGHKLWFFFTTASAAACGGLTTGQTPPYPGTFKIVGKNMVLDVPLPSFVSTAVAGHTGLYGSLITEKLTFAKSTTKVKGKTVGFLASIGCKAKKRPYTVAFTATDSTGAKETRTVSGSGKCS